MLFSELPFFVFFLCYFAAHFFTPANFRIYLIIFGSLIFYGYWRADHIWLPLALSLIGWSGVGWIKRAGDWRTRRRRLLSTLCVLFAPLIVVKYGYFLARDVLGLVPAIAQAMGDVTFLKLTLPLGISFVTFTLTAYVVDSYSGRYRGDSRFTTVLGFVLFFPHLIAGPILRPHELMHQLRAPRNARRARFALGIAIFTLGLVKKLIFADSMGEVVDPVFKPGAVTTGWDYLLAFYGFSIQIYCDFSGYTDMAIGLAYLLRVRLPTNFRQPYCSASIIEFWRRWHITLSHWLRDYLYIPLGGNRHGLPRTVANLGITMVLGGLWHGANWTFVVWGFIHGVALCATHVLRQPLWRIADAVPRWFAVFLTFHFVSIAWVYFRAPDLATAHQILAAPFTADWSNVGDFVSRNLFPILLLAVFFVTHRFDSHARIRLLLRTANISAVWCVVVFFWLLAISVRQGSSAKFIYFEF